MEEQICFAFPNLCNCNAPMRMFVKSSWIIYHRTHNQMVYLKKEPTWMFVKSSWIINHKTHNQMVYLKKERKRVSSVTTPAPRKSITDNLTRYHISRKFYKLLSWLLSPMTNRNDSTPRILTFLPNAYKRLRLKMHVGRYIIFILHIVCSTFRRTLFYMYACIGTWIARPFKLGKLLEHTWENTKFAVWWWWWWCWRLLGES